MVGIISIPDLPFHSLLPLLLPLPLLLLLLLLLLNKLRWERGGGGTNLLR